MMRTAINLVAGLMCVAAAAAESTNQAAIPPDLVERVLVKHLTEQPPRLPFGLVQGIAWTNRTFVDFPPEVLDRILNRVVGGKRLFVPSTNLRIPEKDEKDPGDPEGRTWRGIETKDTGKRVYVLFVTRIEPRGQDTFEVYYTRHNGPLAAGGGSYIATRTSEGWTITRSDRHWVSECQQQPEPYFQPAQTRLEKRLG